MTGWLGWVWPVAPATVVALAWIARACRRAGGRRLPPGLVALEGAALTLLLLAIPSHRVLGLHDVEPVLAAALFALLGIHVAFQAVALRPLLGPAPRAAAGTEHGGDGNGRSRPSILFFLLPLVVYWTLLPWAAASRPPDGDEPYYLLLAHSLAYDQDVDLANNYADADWRRFMDRPIEPQVGDPRGPGGEVYSRHDATLPALLALPYRLGGRTGVLVAMSLLAAALAWAGLRLALRAAGESSVDDDPGGLRRATGGALLAWATLAFTPPLLLYSHQVWVEVPAALALAVAFERLIAVRRGPTGGSETGAHRSWKTTWLPLGAALLALPLLKIRFALIAVPLAALAVWNDGRSRRAVLLLVAALATGLGGILLVNELRYGNPLKMHTWQELDLGAFGASSYAEGLFGLFWDAAFGLFFFAPVWLLAVPAVVGLLRGEGASRSQGRRLALEIALVALPYLVVTAPRAEWYGGWSPPFRYGVVLLPLLAAMLAPLFAERHRGGARTVLVGLGLATAALSLVWLGVPGWTYDLADGRTRLLDGLSAMLGADAARLFPSYVRPRLASWLWPPLSAGIVTLAWWLPRRRARSGRRRLPTMAGPAAAGTVLLLLGLAAIPPAAERLPTRVVDFEDPWLDHRGGHLHPETWTVTRIHYRAGWVIRPYEEVRVPLVPGGETLELTLDIHLGRNNPDPLTLEVAADGPAGEERRLGTWDAEEAGTWHRIELGPFDWNPPRPGEGAVGGDRTLVFRALGPPRAGRQNGFVLDRMEVRWR